jgi:hypothetical protein
MSTRASEDGDGREMCSTSPRLPVLTKAEYFCSPSLSDLAKLGDDELAKGIMEFKVWRAGYGSIQWQGRVDVRGLDLDRIVDIGDGYVELYPASSGIPEPDVGYGLNRPAEVSLVDRHGLFVQGKVEIRHTDPIGDPDGRGTLVTDYKVTWPDP